MVIQFHHEASKNTKIHEGLLAPRAPSKIKTALRAEGNTS